MSPAGKWNWNKVLDAFARSAALSSALVGGTVLLGWLFGLLALESVLPGLAPMKANTALCFLLGGVSLWMIAGAGPQGSTAGFRRRAAFLVASLVGVISSLTLAEYVFAVDLNIDQILFRDMAPDAFLAPGRTAPPTAAGFLVLAVALMLLATKSKRLCGVAQLLTLAPSLISFSAIVGYLYSATAFYWTTSYSGMALHTAAAMLVLSQGVMVSRSECGIAALLASANFGGAVIRRLIPAALLIPIAIGWLELRGLEAGLYSQEFGPALAVTLNVVAISIVIYFSGVNIEGSAIARQEAERASQRSLERLETLHEIDRAILTAESSREIARATLARLKKFIACDAASVILTDFSRGEAQVLAFQGMPEIGPLEGSVFPIGDLSPAEVFKRTPCQYISNLSEVPARSTLLNRLHREGVRSVLGISLLEGEDLVGVLNLSSRQVDGFTGEGFEVAVELGSQLAIAIQHSRLTESYRKLSETLESMINASPLPVIALDRAGKIQVWNHAAERVFGWANEEVIGQMNPLVPEDRREEFDTIFWDVRQGKVVGALETVRVAKDGTRVDVNLWAAQRLGPTGEASGWIVVLEDVRERKRLEGQLRQAQKMEAIGQLAGGIAHDFNNLLGVIMGYGELQLESLPASDPMRKSAQEIVKSADRGASLTRQLLAFSRKQILQPEVLDLNVVVQNLSSMLRRLIGENIEFETFLATSLAKIKADPGQIEQVIVNLAVNARDAMPDGGKLIIRTGNAQLDPASALRHGEVVPGPYVLLEVSDTGHGMDREVQERIFEPFFTTKEKGKGTGLGLATVFGIVKQSGGQVWVYSEPGEGTTFKIYLPRLDEAVHAEFVKLPSVAPLGGTETVLLVEDEDSLRELISEILTGCGYAVLEAENAPRAIEISDRYPGKIDLILTDVVLPGGSGYSLAQQLAGRRSGIKILMASGYPDDVVARRGVLEHGLAFLQKPFTNDGLKRKVREALDGNGPPYASNNARE